jgi:DNA-binding NarL/FixJ family response regulator
MTAIRVLVADDHPVVRKGLVQFFIEEAGFDVCAECDNGEDALRFIEATRPDVAVIDLRMPRRSGIEVLADLRERATASRVILLVGNISDDEVVEAMRLGVKGIVLKEMAPNLLIQSVRKVAAGGTWIEKDAVGRAMEKLLQQQNKRAGVEEILTAREVEIVRGVARGLSNREIGEELFISEGTVKTHLHTIFEKLSIRSRMQLAAYARENELTQ